MPTFYSEQFWVMDPYNPPVPGTVLNTQILVIRDNNNNNLINRNSNDRVDNVDITASYNGDTVTVALPGGGTMTVTGATFYLADGRQVFTPTDGNYLPTGVVYQSATWVPNQSSITVGSLGPPPCFVPGTLIDTPAGPRAVETLGPGDLVWTLDRGAVPVLLRQERLLDSAHLDAHPRHRPIRVRANALGKGLPSRDLTVSPQHRILLRSAIVARLFGVPEILVPANQLVGYPGIAEVRAYDVTYVHLVLDHHAVLCSEGALTESLYLGEEIVDGFSDREMTWLRQRMAEARAAPMQPARPFARGQKVRQLLERHLRNRRPLVEPAPEAADGRLADRRRA